MEPNQPTGDQPVKKPRKKHERRKETYEIHAERGRIASLSRSRQPDDPDILAARKKLWEARCREAADAILSSVVARNNGDIDGMVLALSQANQKLALVEATEIVAYLVRLSPDPAGMVAALRDQCVDKITA